MTLLISALWSKIIASLLVGGVGATGAMMANRRVAVFNDAVRPIMGEENKKNKNGSLAYSPVLVSSTFALCIGYVLGLIPISIAKGVLLIHIILLMTDIIGVAIPNHKKILMYVAGVIGFGWGMGMYWGMDGVNTFLSHFTFKGFGFAMGKLSDVYNAIFGFFPALVIGLMFGFKRGALTLVITLIVFFVSAIWLTPHRMNATANALLIGSIIMVSFVINRQIQDKKEIQSQAEKAGVKTSVMLQNLFQESANNIKKSRILFVISGTLVSAAVAMQGMVGSISSISPFASGDWTTALISEGASTLGFVPLVMLTALATGVYSPAGIKLTTFMGILGAMTSYHLKSNGDLFVLVGLMIAAIGGGFAMFLETTILVKVGSFLSKHKVWKLVGDSVRDSINRILNLAFLVGSFAASVAIGIAMNAALKANGITGSLVYTIGGFGAISMAIVGFTYCINKISKKPLPDFAIGPIGMVLSGIVLNIAYWIMIAAL